MGKIKLPDLQITELFIVKCGEDWTRTYMAQIRREIDLDGKPVICGEVEIKGWQIWSIASSEEEIGETLDALCDLILNSDISSIKGIITNLGRMKINHN